MIHENTSQNGLGPIGMRHNLNGFICSITLDVIPMNWYTKTELRHGTIKWDILHEGFLLTFTFEDRWWHTVDDAL